MLQQVNGFGGMATRHHRTMVGAVFLWLLLAMAAIIVSGFVVPAIAADNVDASTQLFCSHQPKGSGGVKYIQTFDRTNGGNAESKVIDATGVLRAVIHQVNQGGNTMWQETFKKIRDTNGFMAAVNGAVLLYFVIFGLMIVFNMVNLTWYEAFIRMLKIAAVYYLLMGDGMSQIVATFIMGGMNELINSYYQATIVQFTPVLDTSQTVTLTTTPLEFLITPMEKVMNLQFICSVFAFMVAGVAGFGLAVFLLYGLFMFFMAIVGAIATYIKAVIGLTILFAIAPIFIACLLFEQTRRLFDGWLSMCLNFALQPVFVFAFLGFFMVMMDGALRPLTNIYWCFGPVWFLDIINISWYFPVPPEYFTGTGVVDNVTVWLGNDATAGKYGTASVKLDMEYGLKVKDLWRAAGVDLYVVDVLMFCMLSSLCWRYSEYTGQIAQEIVGGGITITVGAQQMMQQLQQAGLTPQGMMSGASGGVRDTARETREAISMGHQRK